MTREEAVESIRRLQALADRTTFPGEAEAAKAKIEVLRERHKLTDSDTAEKKVMSTVPMSGWNWDSMTVVVDLSSPFQGSNGIFSDTNTAAGMLFTYMFRRRGQ